MGRVLTPTWISILVALGLLHPGASQAGGSGLNVLIVANQASSNSLELANYYRLKRQVPPEHVLKISWPGSNIQWTYQEFTNLLLNPILAFVSQNASTSQIQYVVLSMNIPYRISGSQNNSTTSALYYGYKAGSDPNNSYAFSEARFATDRPGSATTNAFLAMMLTANSLADAKRLIDQGVDSDHTSPSQTAWLVKSKDPDRNKRFRAFDNAIFNARLAGYSLVRTNSTDSPPWTNMLGCQLGLANFDVSPNSLLPGAIADSMTSYGGQIFENPGQTTLLEFIEAGGSGSYGTVTEPLAITAKFPDPMVYFYQARGFTLAECYYQSVQQPYQGLLVGEPLAAPWGRPLSGGWVEPPPRATLTGTTNLCLLFSADASTRHLDRLDLFLDGTYARTLTNWTPQAGNRLRVRLNGYSMEYEVPTNATLKSIAAGIAGWMNQPANTNVTQVKAKAYGDRIELQSFAAPLPDGVFQLVDDEATSGEPRTYLAAPGAYSLASRVSAPRLTADGVFRIQFESAPGVSNVLQASTNLLDWENIYSNAVGGTMEFVDTNESQHPEQFYRVAVPAPPPTPELRALGVTASNQFKLQVVGPTNRPYVLQASSDFVGWSDVWTNAQGGDAELLADNLETHPALYYRTRSADSNDYAPVSIVGQTPTGGNVLQVQDNAPGTIIVWASTNSTDWVPIYTLAGSPSIQTETDSASGAGEPLTTWLYSTKPLFLDSTSQGWREFGVELDFFGPPTLGPNSRLTLEAIKTNGTSVTLSVTNPVGNVSMTNFVRSFMNAVNTTPQLVELDGLEADDLIEGFPGQAVFNLRARAQGRLAAEIQVNLTGSSDLSVTPGSAARLNQNSSDLLPRNHLCVSAGVSSDTHYFDFDTTTLADGYHELTAVAYEGTHVYSQTLDTLPVIVANTPLEATLALAEPQLVLPVINTFDLVLTANTNTLQEILLFTTGGFYAGVTNQPAAVFHVNGLDLGIGEHPFYALVRTTDGLRYRTAPLTVTLAP
jgi:uncharacterized protein (TIGR03790 family)